MIIDDDTIAAISTPHGEGGISIVRLSGKSALAIGDRLFSSPKKGQPSSYATGTVHYGCIRTPGGKELVDEVLLTVMRAPGTYTTEDVVEISCHGGTMPSKRILELCLDEGARLAEPGEFTKRAFLNGRIDLSQAEAVLDVIRSETDISRRIAARQLQGEFSGEIRDLRGAIMDVLSRIELSIDFSQEDVTFSPKEEITKYVRNAYLSTKKMLETSEKGMVLREGASVVICGRPNVGKSSLMNALLRHDRVIVTPVAGTTRDVVEEFINIAGVKVRISDTAGMIETRDRVEIEGIKRSKEKLADADVVIFMLDASCPLSRRDEEIFLALRGKKTIIVANKTDLRCRLNVKDAGERFAGPVLKVSALKKKGLEQIEDALAGNIFNGKPGLPEGPVVTNIRHKKALEEAAGSLERAMDLTGENYNGELLASDLNDAVHRLGLIIGESIDDDILDRIFSQFCIGK